MSEHTKNATVSATLKAVSGYESTESHRITAVQWGLIVGILNGNTRAATCVNALAGVEDPEAFMRVVRRASKAHTAFRTGRGTRRPMLDALEYVEQHLKGGDA